MSTSGWCDGRGAGRHRSQSVAQRIAYKSAADRRRIWEMLLADAERAMGFGTRAEQRRAAAEAQEARAELARIEAEEAIGAGEVAA